MVCVTFCGYAEEAGIKTQNRHLSYCGDKYEIYSYCGDKYEIYSYIFKKEQCENCPHRDTCIGKGKGKSRKLRVTTSAPIFYEISQEQKKPEFLEKYKKRSAQEWKNGEMKRFHGMSRARGWGLRSVTFQAKLTVIAVNLKRIAALSA